MHYEVRNFANPDNDRFILSKGHAAPLLYAVYKELGLVSQDELYTYRSLGSCLEGHPTRRFAYAEAATGSLGMGLSIGTGIALSARMDRRDFRTYVLLGDGELTEGSNWEALSLAAHYKLGNLIALVDCNRLGQTGPVLHAHHLARYAAQLEAFGWRAIVIDGHDMTHIVTALDKARQEGERPTVILAKTIKGYGCTSTENKNGFHGKAFIAEQATKALEELAERFPAAAEAQGCDYAWQPIMPTPHGNASSGCFADDDSRMHYAQDDVVATRQAYGRALVDLGRACKQIVALDADVKNSTFAELFEKTFPERFVECFIAEQNMVGMAIGLERRGKIPFISTFAAFFARAHDQLRMASIGSAALRCVGSHAGVSIGADGPSQMGLDDIAMMSALAGSIVLYPADATSTQALMAHMLEYNQGISYLRTTRMPTPVIYDGSSGFIIGGCNVLRRSKTDKACIVAAGVTLFEALKAHDELARRGIAISIIDLYSIKPLDHATLTDVVRTSDGVVITVEDHYLEGGMGSHVCYALRNEHFKISCLAVKRMPQSGEPQELLAFCGIDAAAIVHAVLEALRRSL